MIYLAALTLEHLPVVFGVWWEVGWCRSFCGRGHKRCTGNGQFRRVSTVEWRWSHSSHTRVPPLPPHPTYLCTQRQRCLISTGNVSFVVIFYSIINYILIHYVYLLHSRYDLYSLSLLIENEKKNNEGVVLSKIILIGYKLVFTCYLLVFKYFILI